MDGQAMARMDAEDSWRSRASENGIRVGSRDDDSLMCNEGTYMRLILSTSCTLTTSASYSYS
ncbi:hypothetical protein EI94DRAFT_1169614 [Lactarius quietus]|nr:hypothetical protein EI94DRAFT_1169614 [Lactarius quietus]